MPGQSNVPLPSWHHVGKPDATQEPGHLPVDVVHPVAMVWNQNILHDGQLREPPAAQFDKFHKGAGGHLALAEANGRQPCAALGDADQLFVQWAEPVGTHHQLDQARAGQADPAQHIFTDVAAEVQVRGGDLVAKEGAELVLVEEEVHDQVELG